MVMLHFVMTAWLHLTNKSLIFVRIVFSHFIKRLSHCKQLVSFIEDIVLMKNIVIGDDDLRKMSMSAKIPTSHA